jgi:NADH dehydrogenase
MTFKVYIGFIITEMMKGHGDMDERIIKPMGNNSITPAARVVIVGAGFGGLQVARALVRSRAEVLILDRNNYHTFFPLLYQVAAAELEPEDIIYPVRSTLRRYRNMSLVVDEVTAVEVENRLVRTSHYEFHYDYLVLGSGSQPHFFSVEGAARNTLPMKNIADAITLRNHILLRFERALYEPDEKKRRRMLTFAVIGGGPTGVEFAGALAELIRGPMTRDFSRLDFAQVRFLLLEATSSLLAGLPASLQQYTERRLRRMGVEVYLGAKVSRVDPDGLTLESGEVIPLETAIWTAGVRGAPPAGGIDLPLLHSEQVEVLPTLQVHGHPEVYVVGDLARYEQGGRPATLNAFLAFRQGKWVAHNLLRQMEGLESEPFRYRDPGTLVAIGRNAAVVHLFGRNVTGFPAWLLWLGVHIFRLIGFRNRLLVLVNWAWDYLFFERGVRLIVPLPQAGADISRGDP